MSEWTKQKYLEKYPTGLTDKINSGNTRCSKCDMDFNHSLWKGRVLFFRRSPKRNSQVFCIRCIRISNGKYHFTDEELDNFLARIEVKC